MCEIAFPKVRLCVQENRYNIIAPFRSGVRATVGTLAEM